MPHTDLHPAKDTGRIEAVSIRAIAKLGGHVRDLHVLYKAARARTMCLANYQHPPTHLEEACGRHEVGALGSIQPHLAMLGSRVCYSLWTFQGKCQGHTDPTGIIEEPPCGCFFTGSLTTTPLIL